jgi:bifunctional DNA-binding transcriptional regulator/antitoxin component of YhaV-PrlF toxin-antitoxin module
VKGWENRPLHSKSGLIGHRKLDPVEARYKRQKGFRRYKISSVGQMTLPASARRQWGIEGAGVVEVAHLGNAVVILPSGGSDVLLDAWLSSEDLQAEAARLLESLSRTPSPTRPEEPSED